ncbi:hypothetical protein ACH518_04700 [Methylomonas sp. HW2-6]|uniref:hypothetical protein n=1 Tax=Methylomonas sp. HW2-6 TaxID=3376687 RepID=UPI004042F545
MKYVGLLALGIFVGTIIAICVQKTASDFADLAKIITAILSAALSGVVFSFIEKFMKTPLGDALFMYPIGLAYSLLFAYAGTAMDNIKQDGGLQFLGCLHVLAMAIGTLLVLLFLFSKRFRALLPEDNG